MPDKNVSKTSLRSLNLSGIEAISGLALLLERGDLPLSRHLIIADQKSLERLKAFLRFKNPKIPWYDLPPFPWPKAPDSKRIQLKRRKWQAWASFDESGPGIFLASPRALLKKINVFLRPSFIKKGRALPPAALKGYEEKAFAEREGEFASRGFLMDVFSPAYDRPLRLELLGDQIQSIHLLDKSFKRRERELDGALIPSLYEWSWTGDDRKKLCDFLRKREKLLGQALPPELFKSLARGELYFGFENLFNCLDETCSLDCFSRPPQIWLFEPERAKFHFFEEREKLEKERAFFSPDSLFAGWDRAEALGSEAKAPAPPPLIKLGAGSKSFSSSSPAPAGLKSFSSSSPAPAGLKSFSSQLFKKSGALKEDLKKLPVSHIVFAGMEPEELKKFLFREKILSAPDQDFFCGKNLIFLKAQLKESFFCPEESAYLRAEDFLRKKRQSLSHFDFFRQRARALEFSRLEEGDLLVHRQYGVGEFSGLQPLNMRGKREDFIVLKYREGDKLFVPAYRASQIKKYARKRPDQITKALLDRLGQPKSWERKKARAKKHIQSLAIELIELYRLRRQKKRKPFLPAKEALRRFAGDFPWTETEDQKRAIQEIMADMDRDQPMDRLLTADTGFGKTEVALRAGLRALESGCQVCLLAPTTILSLQHFENLKARFKKSFFKISLLNRFIPPKEKKDIFLKAKEGRIDLLIATHSAFSPQLAFKNLGLLILDEEHRFGVRQKERLFRFRENLDVLSLSATPIPRTLNMALTGIKDISALSRPPAQRKPVKLFVRALSEGAEKELIQACQREKARGGQVLFVHNRVRTLYQRAEFLRGLFPDWRLAIAHGKTPALDKIMLDFFEKKYDLLISTNIIESGMDLPQANTLFVDRAHEMGLSQIYQLKGRVGRGEKQAYCYLLFPDRDRLSVLARERLELLEKYSGLGSSFQLALHDLENRGAGSLFGSEQSGHLQSLGEELYFEILNEQLRDQKEIFIEPEIQLPFPSGIPESYIPEPRLRLLYYKSLSSSAGEEARQAIREELLEDFGPFPPQLSHLFFLLEIREFCKKLLIKDFKASESALSLAFHEKSRAPKKILEILEEKKGKMTSERSFKIPLPGHSFMDETKLVLKQLAL